MKKTGSALKFLPYIFIAVFSVIMSLSNYMNGDDYLWYYSFDDPALEEWRAPNGRLFSNQVTMWLVRSWFFRAVFIAVTLAAFLILLGKLFDFEKKIGSAAYYIPLMLFIMIPSATYCETVRWISAYTNYVVSVLFLLVYLLFMFCCLFREHKPKPFTAVLFLPLALGAGLCVEHMTIYNIVLALAMVILVIKLKKKGIPHALAYLAGAAVSCFLMFGNSMYSEIYSESDSVGNRYFELGFANIMQNAYSYVVMHYTKDFWLLSAVLTAALTVLYFRSRYRDKKYKYLNVCMTICWLYSSYSVFNMCFGSLRANTPAMRIVALETAFSFVYVVAIAYLINVFLENNARIRAYIYLVSTFLVTAPFLVISPVTARCFFANYMFWILLCGELLCAALKRAFKFKADIVIRTSFVLAFASAFIISFECISNKYYDVLRFSYIREQMADEKSRSLNLMLLPYTEYSHDDLKDGIEEGGQAIGNIGYSDYILRYHGIDVEKARKRTSSHMTPYDYYIEKQSE